MAETLTWTQHTFRCRGCERTAFASQEAIGDVRAAEPGGASLSDEEIVRRFDFCLECLFGDTHAGEHVATDVDPCPKGDPDCETGDDGSCHDGCRAPAEEEEFPVCEWCGATVDDTMTIEFAPHCSAYCRDMAAAGAMPRSPITSIESQVYIDTGELPAVMPGETQP